MWRIDARINYISKNSFSVFNLIHNPNVGNFPQLEPDDLRMNCFFDPENDFKLTIDADFPEINRHSELPDDRKFTMISDSDWESIDTNKCGVQIFQDSLCEGSEEDGKVVFEEPS